MWSAQDDSVAVDCIDFAISLERAKNIAWHGSRILKPNQSYPLLPLITAIPV
jgi:hypothetical protein